MTVDLLWVSGVRHGRVWCNQKKQWKMKKGSKSKWQRLFVSISDLWAEFWTCPKMIFHSFGSFGSNLDGFGSLHSDWLSRDLWCQNFDDTCSLWNGQIWLALLKSLVSEFRWQCSFFDTESSNYLFSLGGFKWYDCRLWILINYPHSA